MSMGDGEQLASKIIELTHELDWTKLRLREVARALAEARA
jgi:hypothetical protein